MNAEPRPLPGFGKALVWTLLAVLIAHAIPYFMTDIGNSSQASLYLAYTGASPGVLLSSSLGIDPKACGHVLSAIIVLGTAWSLTRNRALGLLTLTVVGIGSVFTSLGLASALLA